MSIFLNGGASARRLAVAGTLAILALAGFWLYGTARPWGNPAEAACAGSAETLARMRPLARGEVAAFQVADAAVPGPALAFAGPNGEPRTLAEFRGRTVLLNLWATWCAPCRQEMPALDRLQAALGGAAFEVVAINIDTRNLDGPRAWLREAGVQRLAYYADREAKVFQDLRRAGDAEGMPTTLIYDAQGCRLGRLSGPAEWASPEGIALVRAAAGP